MKKFIEKYQKDIALMFNDYNIDYPVTNETVLKAIDIKGEPFKQDLALLIQMKTGQVGTKKLDPNQVTGIIGSVLNFGSQLANTFQKPSASTPTDPVIVSEKKEDSVLKDKHLLILVAAILLIVVLGAILFTVSKK